MRLIAIWVTASTVLAVAACTQPMPDVPVGRAAYPQYFAEYCADCHGANAMGDGPLAGRLDPPPPDLTRISARNGGTFPIVEVMSQIDGYGTDGAMPEFGRFLLDDRTVMVETAPGEFTPAPERLAGMARYLERLQR